MSKKVEMRSFGSIEEILEFAAGTEETARKFYTEWAEKADNRVLSEVFTEFAAEELKHKKLIEDVMAGEKSLEAKKDVPDLKLADHFVTPRPSASMTYQDALLVAIEREVGSIQMYEHLNSVCIDSSLCSMFEALADEEKKHKLKLETIYDDVFMKED